MNEFLAIYLKIKTNNHFIAIDERYNSIKFIILFISSIFIFKMRYYKHQYVSIIIIIALEIIRYIFKIKYNNNENEGRKINSFEELLFLIRFSFHWIFKNINGIKIFVSF